MVEKLNAKSAGLAFGLVFGFYMLCLGLMATYLNWGTNLVNAMGQLYLGFTPTLMGSIIGALWGFFDGFICGFIIVGLYNKFNK